MLKSHVVCSHSVKLINVLFFFIHPLQDAKSHRWKVRLLLLNVSCCAFAGFFYWKHNMYCQPGSECTSFIFPPYSVTGDDPASPYLPFPRLVSTGYTLFALFEYLVVFSNMAFHLTAVWDFKSREVVLVSSSEDKDFWIGLSAAFTATQPPDHSRHHRVGGEEWSGDMLHICLW